ncbi:MAG: GNAT family N-acetyltransferase [Burkholderiaceae bacterium]|nr:GNAT family N-acetyltransferase [Burkholderiaceae bacterium]
MAYDPALLEHIFWAALTGPHAAFASGSGGARRYVAGFSPIIAFADPQQPDFDGLREVCASGEHFYCDSWQGAAPPGWQIDVESSMFRMVWDGPQPAPGSDQDADAAPQAIPLQAAHAAQALALAQLCKPGPFGLRTIELGEYWGVFEHGELIAMAGERLRAPGLCEISGVCTHPAAQGRGLASALIRKLMRRQLLRGATPFLHVMHDNPAHQLYQRMGFRDFRHTVVRVLART